MGKVEVDDMGKKVFRHDLERSEWLLQLHSLLEEGYSLTDSLQLLIQFETGRRKEWCSSLYQVLQSGDGFSHQLQGAGYSKDILNIIHLSEKYGDIKKGLLNAATILQKKYELMKKGRKMLSYPLFLLVGLIFMAVILSEGVFPHFQSFFDSMNQELPLVTRAVVVILSTFKLPVLLLIVCFVLAAMIWFRKKKVYEQIDILIKLPIIRSVTKTFLTYSLASQIAPLLLNGFSLHKALQILQEHSQLSFFQLEAASITHDLKAGLLMSESIKSRPYFDPPLVSIIALGEAKGDVGKELEKYGNFLFNQQFERIQRTIGFLQPVLIGCIGMIVMILFLSMMLPIFNIVDGW